MRKRSPRLISIALVTGMLASGALWAQTVRPVLQRSGEANALPSGATNLKVTFDQSRLVKWANSSLITVPFKVTYDHEGTTKELGAGDHLASYNLKVLDKSVTGTYDYEIFGAPKDIQHLYLSSGSTAESRFAVQRLKYWEECPPDAVRVLLLFDLSSSVETGIPQMASGGQRLIDTLFADLAWSDRHDLAVAVAWFSGQASDLQRIASLSAADFMSDAGTVKNVIATNIVKRVRGSSSGLVDAADESLKALERVRDSSLSNCCPEQRKTVIVLVTISDFVHRTGAPSPAKIANLTTPPPNSLLFGVEAQGEAPNAFTPQLKAALSAANNGTPLSWGAGEATIAATMKRAAREKRDSGEYEYLLYACVAPRDLTPFNPIENRNVEVTVSYGGLQNTASFAYTTQGLKDGCFLWNFDVDQDGFYRNVELDGSPGFDQFTKTAFLDDKYSHKTKGANYSCLDPAGGSLAGEDEDHSGCLPNPGVPECRVQVNCTIEDCKFGQDCDQDGVKDEFIHLKVDRCWQIHQKVPSLPNDLPAQPPWRDEPDCQPLVINPEPPAGNTCTNHCPGDCRSPQYYCGNRIDENADGRDEKCPNPGAPPTCDDSGYPAAASTLEQALARTNTLIIPDVRRGMVGGTSWTTDVRIIAEGPAPGTEHQLEPCCWDLNSLKGTDGFFHAVQCPRGVDVDGNHTVDTYGFCYVEDPWVELFFMPAVNAHGNSATPPPATLSRRLCLPSNGALVLDDVLAAFRTAAGLAPNDVSGTLVVSSNYELLVQNKKTVTSSQCGTLQPCLRNVVTVDDTAQVDAAARTYIKGGAASNLGKRVSATPVTKAFGPNDLAYLFHLTAPDRAANADIGIVNLTPTGVSFYLRLYHADGTLMDTKEWNVAGTSVAWIQDVFTGKVGYDAYATLQVIKPRGIEKWFAWASSTDAGTGDQFWVEAVSASVKGSTGGKLYLPNSSRVTVIPDQRYVMTDVELINLDNALSGKVPATVKYWLVSKPSDVKTVSLLEGGKAYRLIDLIAEGLGRSSNVTTDTLVIEVPQQADGEIAASNHTYRLDIVLGTTSSSTIGSGVGAVTERELVGPGKKAKLPLFGGKDYRSSVVITNPTDAPVHVRVRFYGALGFAYRSVSQPVPPNTTLVLPDPENRRAGTAEVFVDPTSAGMALVYLRVEVPSTGDQFAIIGR